MTTLLHPCRNCGSKTLTAWLCPDCWRVSVLGALAGAVVTVGVEGVRRVTVWFWGSW